MGLMKIMKIALLDNEKIIKQLGEDVILTNFRVISSDCVIPLENISSMKLQNSNDKRISYYSKIFYAATLLFIVILALSEFGFVTLKSSAESHFTIIIIVMFIILISVTIYLRILVDLIFTISATNSGEIDFNFKESLNYFEEQDSKVEAKSTEHFLLIVNEIEKTRKEIKK